MKKLNQFGLDTTPESKPKLLIVDDQAVNIRILHELFREEFDVFMASDGEQALEKCLKLLPDLILLDVVMPVIDGHEVCRQLKANPALADIPVIFITAHYNEADEALGFKLGAVDFIHKPINPIITRARVQNHLRFKQQTDMLRSIALIDGLTGIANRHKFEAEIVNDWLQCKREKQPLSILMIDVDFFKRFNDCYGHHNGDACLRKIAQTLSSCLNRPYDLAARYGGEEFCCLLPNTNNEGAQHVAQAIIKKVRALKIDHSDSAVEKIVTVSIGTATTIPKKGIAPDQLVVVADQQLYRAKELGRNQVCSIILNHQECTDSN